MTGESCDLEFLNKLELELQLRYNLKFNVQHSTLNVELQVLFHYSSLTIFPASIPSILTRPDHGPRHRPPSLRNSDLGGLEI